MFAGLWDSLVNLVNPFYHIGIGVWNMIMGLTGLAAVQTPSDFSRLAWKFVTNDVYPWAVAIGAVILNLSYCIGILRHMGNLRENFTLEMFVECGIKVILGNIFLLMGIPVMRTLLKISSLMSKSILLESPILSMEPSTDAGSVLFFAVFGLIFFIICLVCAGMIFLTVYGRFLQLYLLICTMPFAVAVLPGGNGMSQTTYAWFRTFLAKTFETVAILLTIAIASSMISSINFGDFLGAGGILDGILQAVQNIGTMILLTASVKGMDSFMRRTFAL